MRRIPYSFFNRPSLTVARELIGCHLVRRHHSKIERYMITETEAYTGPHDLACHASRGETPRTTIMFRSAGHIYVYFTYGMHWLLNIVTGPIGYPAAVLIRGIEGATGPARLTKKLGISKMENGKMLGTAAGLWVEESRAPIPPRRIKRTPRIGVAYAGEIWANKKYRFVLVLKTE